MRPSESGGQILENRLECNVVYKALERAGEIDLAEQLVAKLDISGLVEGNLDLRLTPNGQHEIIEMTEEETAKAIPILERVADGLMSLEYPYQRMLAEKMIDRYKGLPTLADEIRFKREKQRRRILPSLRGLVFRKEDTVRFN